MTSEQFVESGMVFGPFPYGHCFIIEKSKCYQRIREGVKIADFLLYRQQKREEVIWVVEVKSSSPRPQTQLNFTNFIDEIRVKLTNSFLLTVAVRLERNLSTVNDLPDRFQDIDLRTQCFRFILVINTRQQDYLAPLQDALQQALKPLVKTWALSQPSVLVLNHDLAHKYGLVQPPTTTAP